MKSFLKNKGKISYTYKDVGLQGDFMNYCRLEAWKLAIDKYSLDNRQVLDVGCSYGSWYDNWKYLGFDKIYGADVNSDVVDTARLKFDRVECTSDTSLSNAFEGKKFNVIGCNGVLVHILRDDEVTAFCREVVEILDSEGYFLVSILPAEYYSKGHEQYNDDNCVRTLDHNLKIIEKAGLEVIDKIGTFINPWYNDDFEWIANSEKMKANKETWEAFAQLSDLLRGETIIPFSELLLVCKKKN